MSHTRDTIARMLCCSAQAMYVGQLTPGDLRKRHQVLTYSDKSHTHGAYANTVQPECRQDEHCRGRVVSVATDLHQIPVKVKLGMPGVIRNLDLHMAAAVGLRYQTISFFAEQSRTCHDYTHAQTQVAVCRHCNPWNCEIVPHREVSASLAATCKHSSHLTTDSTV